MREGIEIGLHGKVDKIVPRMVRCAFEVMETVHPRSDLEPCAENK